MTVAESKLEPVSQNTSVFHSILIATDFSEPSHRALTAALALVANTDACLSAVHVFHPDWRYDMLETPPEIDLKRRDSHQQLEALIASLRADKKIQSISVEHRSVPEAVLFTIAESRAELLVIGTRGRGGLSKLALGSVAEELLRTAPCPVMTIGPKASLDGGEQTGLRTILFATDFGAGSTKALPLVSALAQAHNARLVLLHMIPPMPATSTSLSAYAPATAIADELQLWEGASRKRSLQRLRDWITCHAHLQNEPEYIVGTELLAEGILTAASRSKADLIVMGANRAASPRWAAHLPWTAIHEVIHDAPCPVLTVTGER